jgi:hypothetical protein
MELLGLADNPILRVLMSFYFYGSTNKTLKENYAEGNILFLMLHLPLNCIHRGYS